MSSYSIIRMTPCAGPGTAERNTRTDFGMTGLLNFGSAAWASFFRKSGRRSGLMSYLKMAITDMGFSHVSCELPHYAREVVESLSEGLGQADFLQNLVSKMA